MTKVCPSHIAKAAAAALLLAPLAASADITVELGHVTIAQGSSGALPFTLTLSQDLSVISIFATLSFDTSRIAIDADAPMLAGLSLNALGAMPGWFVGVDDQGVVVDGAPPDPVLSPYALSAAVPYAGVLSFAGLQPGLDPVPVSLRLEVCDIGSCFFANPILPQVVTAQGSVMVTAIPEPATWALFAGGLLAVGELARRRGAAR